MSLPPCLGCFSGPAAGPYCLDLACVTVSWLWLQKWIFAFKRFLSLCHRFTWHTDYPKGLQTLWRGTFDCQLFFPLGLYSKLQHRKWISTQQHLMRLHLFCCKPLFFALHVQLWDYYIHGETHLCIEKLMSTYKRKCSRGCLSLEYPTATISKKLLPTAQSL